MIWPHRKSPFDGQPRRIVHATYHKMGTTWLTRVLEGVAKRYGLSVQKSNLVGDAVDIDSDIVIANHSQLDLDALGEFVGSHMVRDPRDVVVSGYFYHRWTDELWVHQPMAQFGGRSYQQHLKSIDRNTGLLCEIQRFEKYINEYRMREWDYANPLVIEIKYEELIQDEEGAFASLFAHYGFSDRAIRDCVRLTRDFGFDKIKKQTAKDDARNLHLRSGKVGQWRDTLTPQHIVEIKQRFGDLLILQGYESDADWH